MINFKFRYTHRVNVNAQVIKCNCSVTWYIKLKRWANQQSPYRRQACKQTRHDELWKFIFHLNINTDKHWAKNKKSAIIMTIKKFKILSSQNLASCPMDIFKKSKKRHWPKYFKRRFMFKNINSAFQERRGKTMVKIFEKLVYIVVSSALQERRDPLFICLAIIDSF